MTEQDPQVSKDIKHLVMLIHGIRTRALWMPEVRDVLLRNTFRVEATSYGWYTLLSFLFHSQHLESQATGRVLEDIEAAIALHQPERVSIIAHSFGTHIFSKILLERQDLVWYRIIFCGSVLKDSFPFSIVRDRFAVPLLNEVGSLDLWPALAEKFKYGAVGSYGFNRPGVHTRWHNGLRHSDFLSAEFCEKNWVPFLDGEAPIPGDRPTHTSWLSRIPKKLVIAMAAVLAVSFFGNAAVDRYRIFRLQESLCLSYPTGAADLATLDAVREFFDGARYDGSRYDVETEGITRELLRQPRLSALGWCAISNFKRAYEVGRFTREDGSINEGAIVDFQERLVGVLNAPYTGMNSGTLDSATRENIRRVRKDDEKLRKLPERLMDSIDEKFDRMLDREKLNREEWRRNRLGRE
jgi:hypothetical protein